MGRSKYAWNKSEYQRFIDEGRGIGTGKYNAPIE